MYLDELFEKRVRGNLVDPGVQRLVIKRAQTVKPASDGLQWSAGSSGAAAAWLVALVNAQGRGRAQDQEWLPVFGDGVSMLAFRGQRSIYSHITAGAHRMTQKQSVFHVRASRWFVAALQAWMDLRLGLDEAQQSLRLLESAHCEAAVQHYLCNTALVDWTWDPLIAMFFAIQGSREGEFGTVIVRNIPEGHPEIHIPPTFLTRVWRQKGLFERQGGYVNGPEPVDKCCRVVFPIQRRDVVWASGASARILDDSHGLGDIAKWAVELAGEGLECSAGRQIRSLVAFRNACASAGARLPDFIREIGGRPPVFEDLAALHDYVDASCLRPSDVPSAQRAFRYDKRALVTVLCGLPFDSPFLTQEATALVSEKEIEAGRKDVMLLMLGLSEELSRFRALSLVSPVLKDPFGAAWYCAAAPRS